MHRSIGVTVRILGISVTIGPGIVLGLLGLGVLSGLSGEFLAEWVALGFVALLLHELGHALAFRRYQVESSITFWLLGGFTVPNDQEAASRLTDRQMVVAALAGPVVGLVLGAVTVALGFAFRDAGTSIRMPLFLWIFVNLGWAIFNLLPISSLDGGQALVHLAGAVFGRAGRAIGLATGIVASGLIAVLAAGAGLYSVAVIAVVFGLLNPAAYGALHAELRPGGASWRSSDPVAEAGLGLERDPSPPN
jgi:Zn-dependent protease